MTEPAISPPLELIVGLGNPGADYANTRHNAGAWFVEALVSRFAVGIRPEKKFLGRLSAISLDGGAIRLLLPDTYMNESGRSVAALANFYKIAPERILIAHDEIDFPIGKIRFKQGNGLAGHHGLQDISRSLAGSTAFNRLRIGVGRPDSKDAVTGHVLGKINEQDKRMVEACIAEAIAALPAAARGDWQSAMQQLHNAPLPAAQETTK